jgi:hypothetical protein
MVIKWRHVLFGYKRGETKPGANGWLRARQKQVSITRAKTTYYQRNSVITDFTKNPDCPVHALARECSTNVEKIRRAHSHGSETITEVARTSGKIALVDTVRDDFELRLQIRPEVHDVIEGTLANCDKRRTLPIGHWQQTITIDPSLRRILRGPRQSIMNRCNRWDRLPPRQGRGRTMKNIDRGPARPVGQYYLFPAVNAASSKGSSPQLYVRSSRKVYCFSRSIREKLPLDLSIGWRSPDDLLNVPSHPA